jgi:hypothetical protein
MAFEAEDIPFLSWKNLFKRLDGTSTEIKLHLLLL